MAFLPNPMTLLSRRNKENHYVKQPFKHSQSQSRCKTNQVKDEFDPGERMKTLSALATWHAAQFVGQEPSPTRRINHGQLWKGRLKPLYPVRINGPVITQCRGMQPTTDAGAAVSPSRLELSRRMAAAAAQEAAVAAHERPLTVESVHNTSRASTPLVARRGDTTSAQKRYPRSSSTLIGTSIVHLHHVQYDSRAGSPELSTRTSLTRPTAASAIVVNMTRPRRQRRPKTAPTYLFREHSSSAPVDGVLPDVRLPLVRTSSSAAAVIGVMTPLLFEHEWVISRSSNTRSSVSSASVSGKGSERPLSAELPTLSRVGGSKRSSATTVSSATAKEVTEAYYGDVEQTSAHVVRQDTPWPEDLDENARPFSGSKFFVTENVSEDCGDRSETKVKSKILVKSMDDMTSVRETTPTPRSQSVISSSSIENLSTSIDQASLPRDVSSAHLSVTVENEATKQFSSHDMTSRTSAGDKSICDDTAANTANVSTEVSRDFKSAINNATDISREYSDLFNSLKEAARFSLPESRKATPGDDSKNEAYSIDSREDDEMIPGLHQVLVDVKGQDSNNEAEIPLQISSHSTESVINATNKSLQRSEAPSLQEFSMTENFNVIESSVLASNEEPSGVDEVVTLTRFVDVKADAAQVELRQSRFDAIDRKAKAENNELNLSKELEPDDAEIETFVENILRKIIPAEERPSGVEESSERVDEFVQITIVEQNKDMEIVRARSAGSGNSDTIDTSDSIRQSRSDVAAREVFVDDQRESVNQRPAVDSAVNTSIDNTATSLPASGVQPESSGSTPTTAGETRRKGSSGYIHSGMGSRTDEEDLIDYDVGSEVSSLNLDDNEEIMNFGASPIEYDDNAILGTARDADENESEEGDHNGTSLKG